MKRKIYCLLFFVLLCNQYYAQHTRFRRLSSDQGMMSSFISSITQDSVGFMWFGGSGGLCRYDGKNFIYFQHSPTDTNTIDDGIIRSVIYDSDGFIWAGGSGCGLVKINCETNTLEKLSRMDSENPNFLPSQSVFELKEYKQKIYIGTFDIGLWEYDKKTKKFSKLFSSPDMPFISVRGIEILDDGTMWIATNTEGLWKYNLNTKTLVTYNEKNTEKDNIIYNKVRNVYVDREGWVWISFWERGNAVLIKGESKFISNFEANPLLKKLSKKGLVSSFFQDREGYIWFCTAESGAVRFNKKTGEVRSFTNNINDIESIGDNTIFCAFQDKANSIWFGSWKGGAQVLNPSLARFGLYHAEEDNPHAIHNATITCFNQLKNGNVLIGTSNGISEYNIKSNTFSRFDYDSISQTNKLANAHIYSLSQDYAGNIWVAVYGSGLYVFNERKEIIKRFVDDNKGGLSSQILNNILCTKSKAIYVSASSRGLNVYDTISDKFSYFLHSKEDSLSISSNEIKCIAEAKNNKLWIGTADAGLNLFDPKTLSFERFQHQKENPKSILHNSINSLFYDKTGGLWIGTIIGICRYSETEKTFTNYSNYNELLQSEIYAINEDEEGNLWLTTSKGLIRFNPLNGNIKKFDKSSGMHGSEFMNNATLMLKNKKLCIGGIAGFNMFYPSEIVTIPNDASVVFTGFAVLNEEVKKEKDISLLKEIVLDYKDYFFSFNFSLLEFTNPNNNTYAYKLDDFNSDWVYIGTNTSVTFTNLNPGTYTLRVKAANSMGEWSSKQAEIIIKINPPFWKTWWFYTLCVVASILFLYFFIRYREMKLKSEKLKLEIKVDERTKELQQEKLKVEEVNKDIKDSITYAKRIQDAILPSMENMQRHMPEHFVLYKPKDIISGDFYWMDKLGNTLFFAAADCTGHGVPGAMVSVVCSNALNKTVVELGVTEPGFILDTVRKIVVQTFEKSDKNVQDGMDISLCKLEILNSKNAFLEWAGANNPLWLIRNNKIIEFKPNKQPIGKIDNPKPFTTHKLELQKGDTIYIFTDGFADQFGGEKGKKFMYKSLKSLLLSIQEKNMIEQKKIIEDVFDKWKGNLEQVDDVCVIGFRI